MRICLICLRHDRRVKCISNVLVEFHDEICEFGLPTVESVYCSECEHLLKKFCNFRKQCIKALEILNEWQATMVANMPPITHLHTLVPRPKLTNWLSTSNITNFYLNKELDAITKVNNISGKEENAILLKKDTDTFSHTAVLLHIGTNVFTNGDTDVSLEKDTDPIMNENDTEKYQTDSTLKEVLHVKAAETEHSSEESLTDSSQDIKKEQLDKRNTIHITDFIHNTDFITDMENVSGENKNVKSVSVKEENDIYDDINDGKAFDEEFLDEDFLKSLEGDGHDGDSDGSSKNETLDIKHPRNHRQINIEKLKADLLVKFSMCDEIIAKDGTTMDKEMIIKCIQHKVMYHGLRSLRAALHEEHTKQGISPRLKKMLNTIYEQFKDDEKYEDVFDIQYLTTYKMKVEEFEKRKTYDCYVSASYKCERCFLPFKQQRSLHNHVKEYHHENNQREPCPICKARPGKVVKKRTTHAAAHRAVFKCKLCPLVTYYRGTMVTHFGMHMGKQYRCEECDANYRCMSGYFRHMSLYHRRGCHVCAACGRGFPSAHALSAHSKVHQGLPATAASSSESVHCAECDVTFPSRAVHAAHVADVHTPRPLVSRTRKPKDSSSLPAYYENKRTRKPNKTPTKVRHIKCRLCNESRMGGGWLKTHFLRAHPNENWNLIYADSKKHLCDVCGTGFASVYALRDHMTLHTGARPFSCNLCHKRFRSSVLVNEHRRRHFPPAHLCTHCGKKFKSKANLYNHMKVHTGEKTHKCEICGKCFLYACALNEHVRGVHHNIRRVRRRGKAAGDGTD